MSSQDGNPVSAAVHALTRAIEHGHAHRRTIAQAAYAAREAPPAPTAGPPNHPVQTGGAS